MLASQTTWHKYPCPLRLEVLMACHSQKFPLASGQGVKLRGNELWNCCQLPSLQVNSKHKTSFSLRNNDICCVVIFAILMFFDSFPVMNTYTLWEKGRKAMAWNSITGWRIILGNKWQGPIQSKRSETHVCCHCCRWSPICGAPAGAALPAPS